MSIDSREHSSDVVTRGTFLGVLGIAFFDLDLTLLSQNSGSLWVRAELRGGYISRTEALRAGWWLFRYRLGFAALEGALRQAIASLEGTPVAEIRDRTHRWYRREIRSLYRPGARRVLQRHRDAGEACVLLTSSSNYLAELVTADLGLDGYICNRFEADGNEVHTGRPVEPLCFGDGKRVLAERWAGERKVRLADCSVYTDSTSDLPILEAVGHPVAVNPDPRLRRLALRRGWPIEDWGV